MTPRTQSEGRFALALTLIVTNAIKLGGLTLAIHEVLFHATLRPAVLAEAAFMMAGARFSEHVVLAVMDRLLGREPDPPRKDGSKDGRPG